MTVLIKHAFHKAPIRLFKHCKDKYMNRGFGIGSIIANKLIRKSRYGNPLEHYLHGSKECFGKCSKCKWFVEDGWCDQKSTFVKLDKGGVVND